ncbi:MAG TPA: DUF4126 family protein [Aurantimonas sp.]|nr:DUF4126 family protein [Aurantimonas sp.]
MNAPLLIGLVAGARSMTPLATVAWLARSGDLPNKGRLARFLSQDWVVAGATALAVGELLGDKMRSAPDRIVVPGLAARIVSGGIAGAAMARERDERSAGLLGIVSAIGASYVTFAARTRSMRRYGQRPTGVVEDALIVGLAAWIASRARRS